MATRKPLDEEGLRFLTEASSLLASSVDMQGTLQGLLHLAVPSAGDYCEVFTLDAQGGITHVSSDGDAKHVGEAQLRYDEFPLDEEGKHPIFKVMREEKRVYIPDVKEDDLKRMSISAQHLVFLKSLNLGSWVGFPLVAREKLLGAMTFQSTHTDAYGPVELALMGVLATNAALAVDRGKLYVQATAAVEERDEFLAFATHDLRNPLAVMRAAAQMVARKQQRNTLTPEFTEESMAKLERASLRMQSLLDELTDIAKLRAGATLELSYSEVNLAKLAREVAKEYESREGRDIKVEAPNEVTIAADADRIVRVLGNLLGNAIKYAADSPCVYVRVSKTPTGAMIVVEDEGPGIIPEDLPFIFDHYYRGHNARGSAPGTGIGLACVKRMVELHHGTVAVTSTAKGTTFTISLPAGSPSAKA